MCKRVKSCAASNVPAATFTLPVLAIAADEDGLSLEVVLPVVEEDQTCAGMEEVVGATTAAAATSWNADKGGLAPLTR